MDRRVLLAAPRAARPRGRLTLGGYMGLGDYGSTMSYASSLANLSSYPAAQATKLFNQLNGFFQNDLANGVITDRDSLQAAFASAAAQIAANAQNDSANQAAWNALASHLTANANALNADKGYVQSQGNVATTTAGAAADAEQGGDANGVGGLMNVVEGGPGGSSVLSGNLLGPLLQAVGPGGIIPSWALYGAGAAGAFVLWKILRRR